MAKPERSPTPHASTVASCAATDCRHNEDRSCTAGEIRIQVQGDDVVCGTYAPEKPKPRP